MLTFSQLRCIGHIQLLRATDDQSTCRAASSCSPRQLVRGKHHTSGRIESYCEAECFTYELPNLYLFSDLV